MGFERIGLHRTCIYASGVCPFYRDGGRVGDVEVQGGCIVDGLGGDVCSGWKGLKDGGVYAGDDEEVGEGDHGGGKVNMGEEAGMCNRTTVSPGSKLLIHLDFN